MTFSIKTHEKRKIAAFIADLHLHLSPPPIFEHRAWIEEVVKRRLDFLAKICSNWDIPLFIAGDVFHAWNCPYSVCQLLVELSEKVDIVAVPGQHDLPWHLESEKHNSAYGLLANVGVIDDINGRCIYLHSKTHGIISVHGFGWREPLHGREKIVSIAVVHAPCTDQQLPWDERRENHVSRWLRIMREYEYRYAFFGDYHKAFRRATDGCMIVNCGCVLPRTITDIAGGSYVWVMTDDLSVYAIPFPPLPPVRQRELCIVDAEKPKLQALQTGKVTIERIREFLQRQGVDEETIDEVTRDL